MNKNDENLVLGDDPRKGVLREKGSQETWKILLVDDEIKIHQIFKLVLKDLSFEGRSLTFLDAYSTKEAQKVIAANPDTAVILLDMVMEKNDAGLGLVKYIREKLGNNLVRIILMTEQPGEFLEDSVIINYDINDYKAKVELEAKRLSTTMLAALRSFRNVKALADSRQQLLDLNYQLEDLNNSLEKQINQRTDKLIQTNQELVVTNSHLNALFHKAPTVIIILSSDYRIQEWNEEAERIYGCSKEMVLGENYLLLFVPPHFRENFKSIIGQVLTEKDKDIRNRETEIITRNGEEKCLLSIFTLLSDRPNQQQVILCGHDISQRKKTQANLQEREEQLHATFEQAAVGIAHIAPDGQWLRVNQKLCQIVGYSQDELLELTFQDITHADDLGSDLEYMRQMLAQEIETYSLEKRYIRKDGCLVWINLTVSLVWASPQLPKYFIAVVDNISQRKQIEKKLRESEKSYRQIIETAQEGIWLLNPEGNTSFVNPKMAEMLGYTPAEMLGKHLFEFMDDKWQRIAEINLERRRRGIQEQHEFVFRCQDNSSIYTLLSTNPLFDDEGKYLGALAMVADISDRKQAEERLKASEKRYLTLSEIYPVGIFHTDIEGRYLYVNQKWLEIAEIPKEKAFGQGWVQVIHPEDREKVLQLWSEAVQNNCPFAAEYRFQTPEAKITWVFAQATTETDEQGKIVGYVGTVTDITERKQAEENVQSLAARLLTVIETVGEGMTLSNFQGNFVVFNAQMQEITGYSLAEANQADNFLSLLYPEPEALEQAWQGIAETLNLGKRHNQETVIRAKDGKRKTLLVSSSLVSLGQEKLLLTAYRDITEWKKAQEKLHMSEKRLQTIFSSTSDAIMIVDTQGKISFANPAAGRLFGKSVRKLIGYEMGIPMLVEQTAELTIVRPQGNLGVGEMTFSQTEWDEELVYVVSLRDITDRREAEDALRESEERFRQLAENIQEVFWLSSPNQEKLYYVNPAAELIWGVSCQTLYTQPEQWLSKVHPEDRKQFLNPGKKEKTEQSIRCEYRVFQADGETRWISDRFFPIKNERGEVYRIARIASDITNLKKIEKELQETKDRLDSILNSIQDVVWSISAANSQYLYVNPPD